MYFRATASIWAKLVVLLPGCRHNECLTGGDYPESNKLCLQINELPQTESIGGLKNTGQDTIHSIESMI